MNLKANDILLVLLILVVPIYLYLNKNGTENIVGRIKSLFGMAIVYPEQKLKYDNNSAISSVNYKNVGGNPVVNIVRNKGDKVTGEGNIYYKPEYILKDTMSENDIDNTEYRFAQFDSNKPSKAWTDYNISQYPGYYKSDFSSNIYDLKQFFDKQNIFREVPDNREYYDMKMPNNPNCYSDVNGTNVCDFNNKLEKIPVSLYNVGSDGSSILQPIISSEINNINNDPYLAYNYENDKPMNGSNFYDNVSGIMMDKESNKSLKSSIYNRNEISKFI